MIKVTKKGIRLKGNVIDIADEIRIFLAGLIQNDIYSVEDIEFIINDIKENK